MAEAHGIVNEPAEKEAANMLELISELLDPVREMWGRPIRVNSGYRCPELNMLVGGAPVSQHLTGEAADITAGSRGANCALFDMIAASGLEFDQLIDEKDFSWIHISYKAGANRRQVLSL